jgi:predicted HicB family RNase H-like nuclease
VVCAVGELVVSSLARECSPEAEIVPGSNAGLAGHIDFEGDSNDLRV